MPTVRELNASFSVFQKMVWTIIGFIGTLIIGGFAIYTQLADVKTDLAVVKSNTSNIVERLKTLDSHLSTLDGRLTAIDTRLGAIDRNVQDGRADDRVLTAISRIENQVSKTDPVVAGFYVTAFEATLILQFLRPPVRTDNPATLSVGSRVDEDRLRPLPEDVVQKSPRLKGVRYVIDGNNAIALTAPGTDVVFAIL